MTNDKQRDRLVELLDKSDATLKNTKKEHHNGYRANYLLANGVLCPPCKLGDTVYRVVTMGTGVTFKRIPHTHIYKEVPQTIKTFIRCVEVTKNNFFDVCENWDKKAFASKEEAENALGGVQG